MIALRHDYHWHLNTKNYYYLAKVNYLFVTPPQFEPSYPSLAIPCLIAFLKKNGVERIIHKDLNVDSYNYFISNEYLEILVKKYRYHRKYKNIIKDTKSAKHQIRNNSVTPKEYAAAKERIISALELVSLDSEYFNLSFNNLTYKGIDVSEDSIEKIIADEHLNIYAVFFRKILDRSILMSSDVVCISINYETQLLPAITLARLVKKISDVKICAGGSYLTHLNDEILTLPYLFKYMDYIITGEGETPLYSLHQYLNNNKRIEEVENLYFIQGGIVRKSCKVSYEIVKELPTPDFKDIVFNKYFSPIKILPIYHSRGCYWNKCKFCSHTYSYSHYRTRSSQSVVNDIKKYKSKYDCQSFYFVDEALHPMQLESLSEMISDCKVRWGSQIRFEQEITRDLCINLKKSGYTNTLIGLESANDNILTLMGKGTNLKTIYQVIDNLYNAKINIWLMFFLGFPGESYNEAENTLNFIKNVQNKIVSTYGTGFVLTKNSYIHSHPDEYRVEIGKQNDYFILQVPFKSQQALTDEQIGVLLDIYRKKIASNLIDLVLSNSHGMFFSYYDFKQLSLLKTQKSDYE
ncbi:B12-binding domain-containing radical SAM protein [Desulforhopalus singaporensis]|uniref:Radical SAM superfamily enzyme YgiQ, UPF0313 family n=1 Tax=Desulforhopalus singaporensis TaxID=91360 RepID=A0A1H0VR68_9BACT|nr:radical SAM protein [Desulforhopalus singaporensis]SDP81082.1 Radical SAM superfamily enzyme YgiQ, UPF0313 family [Desulforhopalus singaporensis]